MMDIERGVRNNPRLDDELPARLDSVQRLLSDASGFVQFESWLTVIEGRNCFVSNLKVNTDYPL